MLTKRENDVLFHMGYEWWMFCAADDLLQTLPDKGDPDPVRNALVESLAMHGRNLAVFFFAKKRFPTTDWNVTDLTHGLVIEKEPAQLEAWRKNANERCAHLTATRENPLTSWDTLTARRLIKERVDHVKNVLGPDVPPDWPGYLPTTSNLLNPSVLIRPARSSVSTSVGTQGTSVVRTSIVTTGTTTFAPNTTGPAGPKRRP